MAFRTLVAGLLLVAHCAWATPIQGRVVGIADGDTVTVLDGNNQQHKIRLSGIDAPEKAQPFGARAKANLSAMVFGKEVVAECGKVDRYRRDICKILVDGRDVNIEQVKAGLAWWYRNYAREQSPKDREDYEVAEFQAKIQRLGLWADKNPVPPWDWRHDSRAGR